MNIEKENKKLFDKIIKLRKELCDLAEKESHDSLDRAFLEVCIDNIKLTVDYFKMYMNSRKTG